MANYTMENLKADSIKVYDGMVTYYPQFREEEALHLSDVATFNGCYASNNGTLAYVIDGVFYVTPATRRAYQVLREEGFQEKCFAVPFSNWDYPKEAQSRWEDLRAMQRKLTEEDFRQDCIKYCEENYVGELALDDATLARCFVIPNEGVEVKHVYYETTYYPVINNTCFDSTIRDRIGKFCANNGRVVFTYRDGSTRVTKGYWILDLLRAAGYKEGDLFVPFSNGEQIVDPEQRSAWEKICNK